MTLTTTCEIFLHNTRNKDQFIKALLVQLKEPGFLTYQSEGDADTFIVKRALQEATTLQSMLWLKILTYWSSLSITGTTRKNDVFFNTEKRQKLTKVNKWWNIVYFKGGNASDWMDILYVHAGGGCDNIGYSLQRLVCMFFKVVTCLH